jgi:hypothetical protein
VAAAIKRCLRELQRAPLAPRTKDAYGQHIAAYGTWLAGRHDGATAIADPKARDYAARNSCSWRSSIAQPLHAPSRRSIPGVGED